MVVRRKSRNGAPRRSRSRRRPVELAPLIEEYQRERALAGAKDATLKQDRWGLGKLRRETDVLPIDRATALRVFDGIKASNSRMQLSVVVKRFLDWAQDVHGLPNPIPDFSPIAGPRSLPRILTDDEIQRLLDAALTASSRALVMLILNTGVRIGEAASLTKEDIVVHADRMEIEVSGKTGMRRVPISPAVVEQLRAVGDEVHIWTSAGGAPIKKRSLQERFRNMMARAGITGRRLGPHTARHTFATRFIRRGGDVAVLKELLGHKSIQMTQKYVTLAGRDLHAAHAKFAAQLDLGGAKLHRPAHVTVYRGVKTHVEEEWACPVPDPATMEM